ncbi:MAG: glucose-1-phosphate thymidylyltransferase [Dehalococcoidales bacterium]|jgi:glucose-1-phosphate thymidylyltransferase|nr:glucose-1-phosphate thymidylyltransferase [Dehalococcoidales bacterium]MDP6448863.1 sugar phosphate nucleotidyltransferase [Dehalococcoidales bacterium]MDP6576353.1 sugar phosphate nucleotidyltransferase [Dehalococcoidales bacterium]|tara:strand:+ start:1019 stop:2194 length:1176 start_codon:yes stop_codon:yes gene_type:complete
MKQAMVLAAGEGQRLRPFTVNRSKVMLSIAGKPILQYVVEALAQNGIRDIVLLVGYHKEQIFDYMGSGEQLGVAITYVTQEKQLGTAHALAQARDVIKGEFLVLPGDNLIERATITRFAAVRPEALLVKRVDNPARYGVVTIDRGKVRGIVEKPEEAKSNIVSTGIYAFTTRIFDFIESELGIPDVLNRLVDRGGDITVEETDGTWWDVIYPWDILNLNDSILHGIRASLGGTIEGGVSLKGQVSVGKGTVIRANSYIAGPVVIGDGCDIGPNVCLLPATSIGNNVVISPFTEIKNSVIGDDVNIGPGSMMQDSVIDRGCVIQGHFMVSSGQEEIGVDHEHHLVNVGAMLGEGCRLGNNVVAHPGVIVGNYSQVQPLKLIRGRLPDRSLIV